jgi:hypothetical protein
MKKIRQMFMKNSMENSVEFQGIFHNSMEKFPELTEQIFARANPPTPLNNPLPTQPAITIMTNTDSTATCTIHARQNY